MAKKSAATTPKSDIPQKKPGVIPIEDPKVEYRVMGSYIAYYVTSDRAEQTLLTQQGYQSISHDGYKLYATHQNGLKEYLTHLPKKTAEMQEALAIAEDIYRERIMELEEQLKSAQQGDFPSGREPKIKRRNDVGPRLTEEQKEAMAEELSPVYADLVKSKRWINASTKRPAEGKKSRKQVETEAILSVIPEFATYTDVVQADIRKRARDKA